MSQGGFPSTASKPPSGSGCPSSIEVRLRKFEHPMEEAMRGGDALRLVKKRRRRLVGQAAACLSSICRRAMRTPRRTAPLAASGHIQHAHHRSAIDFHRPAERRRSRRRSLSRTTAAVSSGVSASQRRSTTARASDGSRSAFEKSGISARFDVAPRAKRPAAVVRCPPATRRSGCCRRRGGDRER